MTPFGLVVWAAAISVAILSVGAAVLAVARLAKKDRP